MNLPRWSDTRRLLVLPQLEINPFILRAEPDDEVSRISAGPLAVTVGETPAPPAAIVLAIRRTLRVVPGAIHVDPLTPQLKSSSAPEKRDCSAARGDISRVKREKAPIRAIPVHTLL